MKILRTLFTVLILSGMMGCVQKTYKKTVVYLLRVDSVVGVKTVGVRGKDNPLNWEKDLPLKAMKDGKTYHVMVDYLTGYKFTEVKFTLNGDLELKNEKNRRINFSNNDTTYYLGTFNKVVLQHIHPIRELIQE